jgi:4-azaleucine resistance transporter AzlC
LIGYGRRPEFIRGVRAELPILVGVLPFGMIYGVLAIDAGIPPAAAQAMSFIVFAGSSQFLAAQLINLATPGVVVVLSIFVVNLRHALYSASIAQYLQPLSKPWKLLLGYLLTDEAYAVSIVHYQQEPVRNPDQRHWFLLGSGLALWGTWQLSTAAGIYLGAIVPESWALDFTLALTFIALVVINLQESASLAAALSAGITAVLLFHLPYKLGLLIAACVGILVGVLIDRWDNRMRVSQNNSGAEH